MTDGRIGEIKALLAEVRPGPWQWFGNTKHNDVMLCTTHSGRLFVMGFERWGMRGAQPIFQVEVEGREGSGVMRSLAELTAGGGGLGVKYEVPYRKDFVGIGHADARFIAESRSLVDELLAEVERLRASWERVGELLSDNGCDCEGDPPECHDEDHRHTTEDCCLACRVEAAWNNRPIEATP